MQRMKRRTALLVGMVLFFHLIGSVRAQRYRNAAEVVQTGEFRKEPRKFIGEYVEFTGSFQGPVEPISAREAEEMGVAQNYLRFRSQRFKFLFIPKSNASAIENLKRGDKIRWFGKVAGVRGLGRTGDLDRSTSATPMFIVDRIETTLR